MPVLSEYIRPCDSPSISLSVRAEEYDIKGFISENFVQFSLPKLIAENNMNKISNIYSYRELGENWDSYGAAEISETAILNSTNFIEDLCQYGIEVFFTSPGPNGEVSIEITKGSKSTEFIFYPNERNAYVMFSNNEFVNQGVLSEGKKEEIIKWFNE